MEGLWQNLANQLNAVTGPVKTVDAWKNSLNNWKKMLRCRARKLRAENLRTGGGTNTAQTLSPFEEQALDALGIIAVDGHDFADMGWESAVLQQVEVVVPSPSPPILAQPISQSPPILAQPTFQSTPTQHPSSGVPSVAPSTPDITYAPYTPEPLPNAPERRFPSNRRRNQTTDLMALIKEDMAAKHELEQQKWEREQQRWKQEQRLREEDMALRREQQQQMNQTLSLVATAINEMVQLQKQLLAR